MRIDEARETLSAINEGDTFIVTFSIDHCSVIWVIFGLAGAGDVSIEYPNNTDKETILINLRTVADSRRWGNVNRSVTLKNVNWNKGNRAWFAQQWAPFIEKIQKL